MKKIKWSLVLALLFSIGVGSEQTSVRKMDRGLNTSSGVELNTENPRQVVMNNGLVEVTLSNPEGEVIRIKYNEIDNVLEIHNQEKDRGYWDVFWNEPGKRGTYDKLDGKKFKVIRKDQNQVEVSFTRTWSMSHSGSSLVPLNVDKRYIMQRGISGFYFYAIMEREKGWRDVDMDQIRAVFKLQKNKFHYMAISDDRQRIMPTPEDRQRGKALAYPEAVLLTSPSNPQLRGEVDDKYQYSSEAKDNRVHGWISSNPPVGFWMITPSDEFRSGGPTKQDLTSHVGPVLLSMFTSTHYAGKEMNTEYRNGEPWKKVFGPSLVYLNSVSSNKENLTNNLWQDAKRQMMVEVRSWPYNFPQSQDFPTSNQRGQVSGQLQVRDGSKRLMWADSAYVGLAAPGEVGSWQREAKGYQFWTKADEKGFFRIPNVREGVYNLYAWIPGIVGDFKHELFITVRPGSKINLGLLVYRPPRNGPTLWEIGFPDRSASEFFVPDPYPTVTNRLYTNHSADKFRQYGLWRRYADYFPHNDLQFVVGVSDYSKHWFFAHVTRNVGNGTYKSTTWRVIFDLKDVNKGNYTLQLALASATESNLQVRFNNPKANPPHFETGVIGKDNAIARHGIHGLYRFYSIGVPSFLLVAGKNTIYLTQSRSQSPFQGVMYDYIRLEAPL